MSGNVYSKYKTSNIKWLGKIPAHWEVKKLKYISSIRFSNVDKNTVEDEQPVRLCNYVDVYYNDFITDNLELMNATATPTEIGKFTLREGDILITKDSETWEDIAVPALVLSDLPDTLCGYHLAQIRPRKERLDSKYLFKALCSRGINDQFRVAATGVTRFGLGKYWLDNGLFLLPPVDEQRAIAAFLDRETARIDTLIEKKQRQIELLQEKRSALISHVVTKGLNPKVKMKNSGLKWLGKVPKHWEVQRAKVLFKEVNERSVTGKEELLTVSHITGVTRRSEKNVTMFMAESLEGYKKCNPNDLIINTMWAWMGALGITSQEGIVSPSYNVYRPRKNNIMPKFYDYLFRTGKFLAEVVRYSKGIWTSRLRLYPEEFFEIRLPYPPPDEQRDIVAAVQKKTGNHDVLQHKIEQSIKKLYEYRTALISAAVTGKIDLRKEVSA